MCQFTSLLTEHFDWFLFSVYRIETDNLCLSGNILETKKAALENVLDKTLSAVFLSNRNILTRSLSLKSRLDIRKVL